MSVVADIIRAIDAEGSTSWAVADEIAALDEIDETTGKPLTLKQVSERIWAERGVQWSPAVLGKYRATAVAFPIGVRTPLPFSVHEILRAHPDKLLKWKPTKPGQILTVEGARALRGGGQASRSTTSAESIAEQARKLVDKLDRLAELEPAMLVDLLGALVADWQQRYAKRIERRRGLTAVS